MTDKDRIRLAEAMGLFPNVDSAGRVMAGTHARTRHEFNPFTDANDDYAVLEWMRGKWLVDGADDKWEWFCEELFGGADYTIGDYARAALKVLDTESSDD